MATDAQQQYLALAQGLNKDRAYCFIDVEELRREYGTGPELERAAREEIIKQLKAQGVTPTEATLRRFVGDSSDDKKKDDVNTVCSMANDMAHGAKLDGDAKISRQGSQEIAMVYWAIPAKNEEEFITTFIGYKGKIAGTFLNDLSFNGIKNELILHEMGHATSRERNQENTSVTYETGPDGLYRNHRSELRAEIVGAMERMRTENGSRSAEAFEDMRAENWFQNINGQNADKRVQPYMEYYIFSQAQKVIAEAKRTGHYNFTDAEIAQTADRVMQEEDRRLQATRRNGDGGELEREGIRLGRIAERSGHNLQTAIDQGMFGPQDRELVRTLAAAHQRISGQQIHGVDLDAGSVPPAPPSPPGPPIPNDPTQDVLRELNSVAKTTGMTFGTGMTFVFKDGEIKSKLSAEQERHFRALSRELRDEAGGSMPLILRDDGWIVVARSGPDGTTIIPLKANEINPNDLHDYVNKASRTGVIMNGESAPNPVADTARTIDVNSPDFKSRMAGEFLKAGLPSSNIDTTGAGAMGSPIAFDLTDKQFARFQQAYRDNPKAVERLFAGIEIDASGSARFTNDVPFILSPSKDQSHKYTEREVQMTIDRLPAIKKFLDEGLDAAMPMVERVEKSERENGNNQQRTHAMATDQNWSTTSIENKTGAAVAELFGVKNYHVFDAGVAGAGHEFSVMLQVADNKAAVDKLIDDRLISIRQKAGLSKEQLGFSANGYGFNGVLRDSQFKDGQLVLVFHVLDSPEDVVRALGPFASDIKTAVNEAGGKRPAQEATLNASDNFRAGAAAIRSSLHKPDAELSEQERAALIKLGQLKEDIQRDMGNPHAGMGLLLGQEAHDKQLLELGREHAEGLLHAVGEEPPLDKKYASRVIAIAVAAAPQRPAAQLDPLAAQRAGSAVFNDLANRTHNLEDLVDLINNPDAKKVLDKIGQWAESSHEWKRYGDQFNPSNISHNQQLTTEPHLSDTQRLALRVLQDADKIDGFNMHPSPDKAALIQDIGLLYPAGKVPNMPGKEPQPPGLADIGHGSADPGRVGEFSQRNRAPLNMALFSPVIPNGQEGGSLQGQVRLDTGVGIPSGEMDESLRNAARTQQIDTGVDIPRGERDGSLRNAAGAQTIDPATKKKADGAVKKFFQNGGFSGP